MFRLQSAGMLVLGLVLVAGCNMSKADGPFLTGPPDQIRLSFGDFQRINEQMPDEIRLTNSELATLERNPNVLLDFGITPPGIQLTNQVLPLSEHLAAIQSQCAIKSFEGVAECLNGDFGSIMAPGQHSRFSRDEKILHAIYVGYAGSLAKKVKKGELTSFEATLDLLILLLRWRIAEINEEIKAY